LRTRSSPADAVTTRAEAATAAPDADPGPMTEMPPSGAPDEASPPPPAAAAHILMTWDYH